MAGEYQVYAEYKDSGLEWLGNIPKDWSLFKHKYIANFKKGKNPAVLFDENRDGTVKYLSMEYLRGNAEPSYAEIEKSSYLTHDGQVLIIWDGSNAGEFVKGQRGIVSSTMAASEFISEIDKRYYWYACVCLEPEMRRHANGMGIPHVNGEELKGSIIPLPKKIEQEKIANFLDHETAKIDTLIEKQQQLIKLLKEKRQAVISHAVTKGLNLNAPMRDSGVEWLGEVPEHWEVSKFGYISQVVRGGSPRPAGDPTLFNGDYSPWVTVAEITKDDEIYLTETETFLTKKGSEQCRVFSSGTLLLSNSGATLGVPSILKIDANANDGVVGFESLKLNHEFAYHYLSILTDDLRERIKQGSGQPNLNTDIVKDISVPVPPEVEVEGIVASIRKTRDQFKKLEEKAISGIKLLQERHTALISAAVTGKIDVRNWQAKGDGGVQ